MAETARLNELAQKRIGSSLDGLSPSEQSEYFSLIGRREKAGAAFTVPDIHSVSPEADKNRLAHIFLDDRTDAEGNKVLFVQELQSDWAQQGRDKGFVTKQGELPAGWETFQDKKSGDWYVVDNTKTQVGVYAPTREEAIFSATVGFNKGIPAAPFVTTTDDWVNLALKRVIKDAVDNGYDKVAFIKGEQAAKKYRLSNVVNYMGWTDRPDGGRMISLNLSNSPDMVQLFVNKDGVVTNARGFPNAENKRLDQVVGKDLSKKIMSESSGELEDEGIDIGGQGMKGFYDNILPKTANKLLSKLGSKIEEVGIEDQPYLGFKITPEMADKVRTEGLPQFAAGGEVTKFIKAHA